MLGRPRTQSWGFISLLLARSTTTELSSKAPGISGLANLSSNSCRRVFVWVESESARCQQQARPTQRGEASPVCGPDTCQGLRDLWSHAPGKHLSLNSPRN